MPHELDHEKGATAPAGGEATGDALAPRSAAATGAAQNDDESAEASPPRADRAAPPGAGEASRTSPPEPTPPLITAVEIENFKGIGRPVRIDLRPITLLFGRNSAGKSTVLHALCYAHEILSHRNVDAHKTSLGGDQIDLGGFRQFVHQHDSARPVRLRFELDLRHRVLPDLTGWGTHVPVMFPTGDIPLLEDHDVLGGAEAGWLELTVEWHRERDKPIVSCYEVGVDGHLVGRITQPVFTGEALLLTNLSHPLLGYGVDMQGNATLSQEVGQVREAGGSAGYGRKLRRMTVRSAPSSALPPLDQMLWIMRDEAFGDLDQHSRHRLSTLLPGIGSLLRGDLAGFRYLGPLRDLHPGISAERRRLGSGPWADGSAAWDLLNDRAQVTLSGVAHDFSDRHERDRNQIVPKVSEWLSREDRLDTGYELQVHSVVELPANTPLVDVLNRGILGDDVASILAKRGNESGTESPGDVVRKAPPDRIDALADGIANAPVHREIQLVATRADLPVRTSDIGVGVSQLLPVVVAALDPDRPEITAIEQPELHVHPRLQVELGDLFVEQADGGRVFLIETHSEHLLLRIMRRMRETSAGALPEGAPAVRPEDVSVLFVEPDGPQTLIREMPLNERGELVKAWPGGFFEEDLKEIF